MGNGDDSDTPDYSDQKLTPERAIELTEGKGLTQTEVASMYDVSQGYVSQMKNAYESGKSAGKDSVEPSDFSREQLEEALEDTRDDEDVYECSECGKEMDYMEYEECPNCDTRFNWEGLNA